MFVYLGRKAEKFAISSNVGTPGGATPAASCMCLLYRLKLHHPDPVHTKVLTKSETSEDRSDADLILGSSKEGDFASQSTLSNGRIQWRGRLAYLVLLAYHFRNPRNSCREPYAADIPALVSVQAGRQKGVVNHRPPWSERRR